MPRITEVEKQERIERTYQLLARGKRPAQITKAISEKYKCARNTVRTIYLARAREMMVTQVTEAKQVMRAKSLALYQAMLEDADVSARDKIKAQERIDKLMMLEEIPQPIGNQVNVILGGDDDARSRVAARIDRERARRGLRPRNGKSPGPGGNGSTPPAAG